MLNRDVPRAQWPAFLESFSRQHHAWLARVDRDDTAAPPPAGDRPLEAVTPALEHGGISAIDISFAPGSGAEPVRICNPSALRVERTEEGADRSLEIVDDQGRSTRLAFRATVLPEMLDGIAPGEL